MDKSALAQAMRTSISEVLEKMFFMPIDFVSADAIAQDPEPDPAAVIARLGFHGSPNGTFVLRIPLSLAQSLSADFLGTTTPSLSKDQVTGTVLEMVNMLAGGTLSKFDHQALFNLQFPELITASDLRSFTEEFSDRIAVGIQTAHGRMTFQIFLH